MAAARTSGRPGLVGIRLGDVPLGERERASTRLLRNESSIAAMAQLALAVRQPSDRVYWIPRKAYEDVAAKWLAKKRRRR